MRCIVCIGCIVVCLTLGPATGCERRPARDGAPPVSAEAVDASLDAAERYLGAGDTARAEAILTTLLDRAPRDYRAHELYGRTIYLQAAKSGRADAERLGRAYEQYRAAVETARAAGVDAATLCGLHQSAGEIAGAAGRPPQALEHFRAAGGLDPANPKHPLYEAQILVQMRRLDEAEHALGRVLEHDPDEPFAHATLATIALARGDCAAAVDHAGNARAADPESLAVRVQSARIHRDCGEPRRALELLLGLDAADRAAEPVAEQIAACYLALGKPLEAAAAWEHRFQARPGDPRAWRAAVGAAEALMTAGDVEGARWWSRQADLAAPQEPLVQRLRETLQSPPP